MSGPKSVVTIVVSDRDFPIKVLKVWRTDDVLVDFWNIFYCACAETVVSEVLDSDNARAYLRMSD